MRKIAIVGLGYVGLDLALSLGEHQPVLGYDISLPRVKELKAGHDRNLLFSSERLAKSKIDYVSSVQDIKQADFFIITVSTPAYYYELPDLEPLIQATKELAGILKKGDIIVYESTVYPGTTEEVCLPLLEEASGLRANHDFYVGYSPERVNPKDKAHNLKNVPKIIAAQNEESLRVIESVYKNCCDNLYPVSNIKTAEAVKILENTQRDINIALMNEFSEIMHAMDINTHEVIEAAKTKWNFMPYKPGLVGGHCISIDPLYLAFKAKRLGVNHDLILTARKINDGITRFIFNELIHLLLKHNLSVNNCSLGIFGLTYKENIPDIRNSLALKLIKELRRAGFSCQYHEPYGHKPTLLEKYEIETVEFEKIRNISVAIILVGHDYYHQVGLEPFLEKMGPQKIIMDIPNMFIDKAKQLNNVEYWSL